MEERTRYLDIENLSIDKITEDDSDALSSFFCGRKELDEFFHNEILICIKHHYVSAYCVRDAISSNILAVFTLANDAVMIGNMEDREDFIEQSSLKISKEYISTFEKQTSFHAVNIGHLGVRTGFQSLSIGQMVIDFVLYTFSQFDISGCQFVTVDSLNNQRTNKFYMTNNFLLQTSLDMFNETRRMYLPIQFYKD